MASDSSVLRAKLCLLHAADPGDTLLRRPNGIVLSPDERTLYVAAGSENRIWAYDLPSPGVASNPRPFATVSRPDGLTTDMAGNVYAAGSADVYAWNSQGDLLFRLRSPENPRNLTFAGVGQDTLYVTAEIPPRPNGCQQYESQWLASWRQQFVGEGTSIPK